ncbi:MAG: AbrB/MazE/SpoVT family DNA-binding domain-containing protein [archaeon]
MLRKLVKQGNNALTLTLPKKWLLKYNLHYGDSVNVLDKGNELVISSKPTLNKKQATLDLDSVKNFIPKYLNSLYRQGYTDIIVTFTDKSLLAIVNRTLVENMIGFEIVEQNEFNAVIKCVASGDSESFNIMFRRSFLITASLLDLLLKNIESSKFETKAALSMETTNNKLTNYCRRCISILEYDEQEKIQIYCSLEILERIADELKFAFIHMEKKSMQKKQSELRSLALEVKLFFDLAHKSFFDSDIEKYFKESEKAKNFIPNYLSFKCDLNNVLIYHSLLNVYQYCIQLFTHRLQALLLKKEFNDSGI